MSLNNDKGKKHNPLLKIKNLHKSKFYLFLFKIIFGDVFSKRVGNLVEHISSSPNLCTLESESLLQPARHPVDNSIRICSLKGIYTRFNTGVVVTSGKSLRENYITSKKKMGFDCTFFSTSYPEFVIGFLPFVRISKGKDFHLVMIYVNDHFSATSTKLNSFLKFPLLPRGDSFGINAGDFKTTRKEVC